MLLKNLMEDKQLDFDQPLLSVRRHSPAVTSKRSDSRRIDSHSYQVRHHLPTYKSELKSGPIRNPGAVPFLWEQSPGRPKEETKPECRISEKPPTAPRLPPGRAKQQDSHKVSHSESKRQDVVVSTVPSIDSSKDRTDDEGSDDEAYVDALDTLSRTESSFLNWSVSGLSGAEDVEAKSFSRDPKAREFVMDRFLPAAKAIATETPHAAKKQTVQLQIKPTKRRVNQDKPSLRYGPSFAKRYAYRDYEEEEESDDEFDRQAKLPSVCGLLPRFCLLSPVPAVSVRTRVAKSSVGTVRTRSSSTGSYSELENESRSDRTETNSVDKEQAAQLDEDKAKLRSGSGQLGRSHTYLDATLPFLEQKDDVVEKTLYVDTLQKVEGPSSRAISPYTQHEEGVLRDEEDAVKSRNEQMQAVDSPHEDLKKLESSEKNNLRLPAPPPLPNSPSDSWLHRTLPYTAKKSSLRPYLGSAEDLEKLCFKAPASDMKWETIVKTSKVQRRHMHYSEESLTTIPEA